MPIATIIAKSRFTEPISSNWDKEGEILTVCLPANGNNK
jgi:hypothetical protein